MVIALTPTANASGDGAERSGTPKGSPGVSTVRKPGGGQIAPAQDPSPTSSGIAASEKSATPSEKPASSRDEQVTTSIGSAVLSPLSGLGASTNQRFSQVTAELLDQAVPSPPTACPAPDSEFVDSWGAPRSGGRRHLGVDMMAPYGSPALAPVDGVIRGHSSSLGGVSYYLDGDDDNEYFGTHLQTMTASGRVEAGQQVGTVGSTGNAGSPHLHFEVKLGGTKSVNPYPVALAFCS